MRILALVKVDNHEGYTYHTLIGWTATSNIPHYKDEWRDIYC